MADYETTRTTTNDPVHSTTTTTPATPARMMSTSPSKARATRPMTRALPSKALPKAQARPLKALPKALATQPTTPLTTTKRFVRTPSHTHSGTGARSLACAFVVSAHHNEARPC